MSLPSIVSYGAGAKTSTLVWDSDLTIPDGFAIESASGEVGIIGDVSISGAVSAENGLGAMKGCYTDYFSLNNVVINGASLPNYNSRAVGTPYCFSPTSDMVAVNNSGNSYQFYLLTSKGGVKNLNVGANSTTTLALSALPKVILGIALSNPDSSVTLRFSGVGYRAPVNLNY